jgi:hypothetical protein
MTKAAGTAPATLNWNLNRILGFSLSEVLKIPKEDRIKRIALAPRAGVKAVLG